MSSDLDLNPIIRDITVFFLARIKLALGAIIGSVGKLHCMMMSISLVMPKTKKEEFYGTKFKTFF
jgi:hypothetical protein